MLVRVTENCPWNRCEFCSSYKDESFRVRPMEDVKADIVAARGLVEEIGDLARGTDCGARDIARLNGILWVEDDGVKSAFLQDSDSLAEDSLKLKTVTKRQPTNAEMEDLLFAWRAVKHIKSNAIALVKDKALLGMGAGQPNRVVSVDIAKAKAGDKARGSVMASDAMFPFPDSVNQAAEGGITGIIQPGGSIRDEDSIKAADKHNIAMLFTGVRHFLH